MSVTEVDLSTVPGAMERTLRRELPDGSVIEFEEARAGFLKKDGMPRLADWRAYFYTPAAGKVPVIRPWLKSMRIDLVRKKL